jgi:hypothetical protein
MTLSIGRRRRRRRRRGRSDGGRPVPTTPGSSSPSPRPHVGRVVDARPRAFPILHARGPARARMTTTSSRRQTWVRALALMPVRSSTFALIGCGFVLQQTLPLNARLHSRRRGGGARCSPSAPRARTCSS